MVDCCINLNKEEGQINMNQHKRILFAGDPHGNFRPLIKSVHKHKPEAVILLGDYDLDDPLDQCLKEIAGLTEIWWIAGNHDFETPEKYNNLFHSAFFDRHLHLKVTEIAGLRVAGLSGIFMGRVWYPPQQPRWLGKQHYLYNQSANLQQPELSLKYKSAIWPDEFEAFKLQKADILVSHEAPGSHRYGFKVISELAAAMGVKHVVHGHLHESFKCVIKNNIKVLGVADTAVADLLGNRVS